MKPKIISILLAVLSAILLIISTAGFGWSFTVFFAFIPLLFAVRMNALHPFITGTVTGFLYWVVCLSWMTVTFTYFGNAPLAGSLALLIIISLIAGFAFFAPFTYIARRYSNPLLLAMVFIALEAAKSALFFAGVPWLNLAQSQYKNIIILQFVSVFGEFGLSFIIVVINILLFKLLTEKSYVKNIALTAAATVIMLLPGVYRLISPLDLSNTARVKIIQTGYRQEDKWIREKRLPIAQDLNRRLMGQERGVYDLIVLPESSYPGRVLETQFILDVIYDVAKNTPIILGTERRVAKGDGNTANYNSMLLFDNGTKLQIYDKQHLTPFGEYFPLMPLLKPLKVFFFGTGSMFDAGDKSTLLITGELKIAPIICFEGAFSELLKAPVAMGANIIAVISNDSWFGKNQGRYQHLAVDAVRAAEYARSSVRATQDGISAVILPDGSVPISVTEQVPAEIDYNVPLIEEKTIYSRFRYLWIAFIIPLVYYSTRRQRKNGKND